VKYIILSILVLFSLSAYSQIEDTPLFVGKYFGNQSGGGSGYWQVTGNFTDESGYYDATSIQVGDVLFFVDAGIGYHLPVTSIISASGSSFTIRVNNTGISGVAGVPNGPGGIYRANSPKGIWPFTAGLTASDQQTLNSFLIKRLNNEPVKRDTFITVPHSTNYIPNLVITTPSRFYNNIYISCKGISDTSTVAFLAAPTSDHYGVVYNVKNDSGLVETRVLSDAHLSNVKTSYLLRRGQTAQVRALKDQAQSGAYKWAVNLLWDSTVTGGGSGITALTGDVTASGTGSVAATIANDAVTSAKIASNAIDSTKAANLSPNDLAQTGATSGQVLTWTGSKYAPRTPSAAGQSSIQFKDEGTNLGTSGTVTDVNVTGSGGTASRSGNTITIDIPGGGGGGISTQTLADTAKNVRNMVRDYATGYSKLTGVLGWSANDLNQEYDFIPNKFSITSTPVLNYIHPDYGYVGPTTLIGALDGGAITYNAVDNEFSRRFAEKFTAAASSGGKVFLQLSSGQYPELIAGSYSITWRMRTESGTYNIKHGTLASETTTSLSTTWTTFTYNFTYTGSGTTYIVLCMETGGNAVDVRIGDIFLLRQSPIYPPVARSQDGHAYTFTSNFQFDSKLLYRPEMAIITKDSVSFDTVCITAVVRPTWPSVPSYGSILSDRLNFSRFYFGTQTDSSFILSFSGGTGANSPVVIQNASYLGKNQGYVIVIQKIGGTYSAYINGVRVQQDGIGTNFWIKEFWIGRLNNVNGFTFPGFVEDITIYKGVCDPVLLTKQLMASTTLGKETSTEKCVFSEGDSITGLAPSGGAPKLSAQKTRYPTGNLAVSGTGVVAMTTTRKATMRAVVADAVKIYKKVIVTIHMGANDMTGYTGAAYYAATMPYVAELRALGAKVVICTVLPRNAQPTFNTNRDAYNVLLRAGVGTDFDGLVDYDTTIMGLEATTANTTYYSDGLHPTLAGQQLLEPVFTAAVRSL